jgi:mono/diheme cytochrome c family protein
MPVVLPPSAFPVWLDPETPVGELQAMLWPYERPLDVFPVSTMVNNGRVDEAMCLVRAGAVGLGNMRPRAGDPSAAKMQSRSPASWPGIVPPLQAAPSGLFPSRPTRCTIHRATGRCPQWVIHSDGAVSRLSARGQTMIGNLLVWLALVTIVVGLGWSTRRAWRSRKPALKWGGGAVAGLLTLVLALASVVAGIGLYTFYAPRGTSVRALHVATTPAQVARGEHLAQIRCVGCHTQNDQLPLSGGRNIASDMPSWGAFYPINLTPSGPLKDWSDGEIMRVLDEGVDRSRRPLLAMASTRPARYVNEGDKQALIAYLRSQPAVVNSTPDPPDRPTLLLAVVVGGAQLLGDSKPEVTVATVPKAPTAEYGQYVVGWANCRFCHGDDLSGGTDPMGPKGPNLRLVQAWTPGQFMTTLRTGKDPGGHVLSDEMPWKDLRHLDDEEMSAVYAYLTSLPPAHR